METRALTTLSFAVVGTLIDAETGIREWFRPHLRDHDREDDDDAVLTAFRTSADDLARAHPELSFTALLPRAYASIARAWELDTDEAAALDFRDSIRDWPAFPDAVSALRQLRDRFRLAAVTTADQWGMEAMSRTLGDPFELLVTPESAGASKPDPQVWAYLLASLDARPDEVLHCSASQYRDIVGANASGLRTAWIERATTPEAEAGTTMTVEPDIRVRGLAELVDYLCAPVPE